MKTKKAIFGENEYYLFSNWSAHQIKFKGQLYPTVDHAYHIIKFDQATIRGKKIQNLIRKAKSPMEAKTIAYKYKDFFRENWEKDKVKHMKLLLIAKVKQHQDVRETLIQTNNLKIVEHNPYDGFWGNGSDGKGLNTLGNLWMEIRDDTLPLI